MNGNQYCYYDIFIELCTLLILYPNFAMLLFIFLVLIFIPKEERLREGLTSPGSRPPASVSDTEPTMRFSFLVHLLVILWCYLSASSFHVNAFSKVLQVPFSEIRIHAKTMATRKRCKLSRTGTDFENVIKRLLCVRTFHTRIGGDLTPGLINRGRAANAEQMCLLRGSAQHFNVFSPGPLSSRGLSAGFFFSLKWS